MNIQIIRHRVTPYGCDGSLIIEGTYVCDTTENAVCHLPAGSFRVTIRHSKVFGRRVPVLIPVEVNDYDDDKAPAAPVGGAKQNHGNAVIGFGNGLYTKTDCRIHVGVHRVSGLVINSFRTFKTLYDRINTSIRRKHEVTLTIIERL